MSTRLAFALQLKKQFEDEYLTVKEMKEWNEEENPVVVSLFSLHIHSMWETICDALASWSGWEFGSKIPEYPILGFGSQNTPPPEKFKLRLFTFDLPRIPPQKIQTLVFFAESKFHVPQNTPPPKIQNFSFLCWIQISCSPEYPPKIQNFSFLCWIQISCSPEYPPPKIQNFSFLCWIQISCSPEYPPKFKTLVFFAESKFHVPQNTPPQNSKL